MDEEGYIGAQVAYLPGSIKRQFLQKLQEVCVENCTKLEPNYSMNQYKPNFDNHHNLVTWGVKMPQAWYDRKRKNILYCENGLLNQHAGIYVDHRGWFGDSSIVVDKEYENDVSLDEEVEMEKIARKWLKFPVFFGSYDPNGPILVALQRQNDAPVRYHYKHANWRRENSILSLIRIVSGRFKDRDVIVRPHPKHMNDWYKVEDQASKLFGDRWSVEIRDKTKMSIGERVKRCSKVITINSTVATEALYSGIPIATLGGGSFNNSGATFECYHDLDKLKDFDDFTPDGDKVRRYLGAVLRHQISYGCELDAIRVNKSIRFWLDGCWDGVQY